MLSEVMTMNRTRTVTKRHLIRCKIDTNTHELSNHSNTNNVVGVPASRQELTMTFIYSKFILTVFILYVKV